MQNILVTAGSTEVPIDKVRCISNIFKGKTGFTIAQYLKQQGHNVTLITSNSQIVNLENVLFYSTYDELYDLMKTKITNSCYDVIIHSAAVSDYKVSGVCIKNEENELLPIDSKTKISSEHKDIFLHLVQTQKIIDLIRSEWGFDGYLVKFKLQVGIDDEELIKIAQKSRLVSKADMIVANCLEWYGEKAYIITEDQIQAVKRSKLPDEIYQKFQEVPK